MGTRTKAYLIEFNKLKMGLNEFEFMLDETLLAEFEYAPIEYCQVKADLKLFKTESMYDLKLDFKGVVKVICDTCAEDIPLPIAEKFSLIMKLSEANNFDDTEMIYIARTEIEFDLKQYLYESLMLSLPQKKNCDNLPEPKPCNQDVLNKLAQIEVEEREEEEEEEGQEREREEEERGEPGGENGGAVDPRWDKLKDLLN
ncbi:MAG: YceD family protein [Bacteroidia bacterium]